MSAAPVIDVEEHLDVYRRVQGLLMQAETELLRITTETELYSPLTEDHISHLGDALIGCRTRIQNLQADMPAFLDRKQAETLAEEEACHV